MEAILLLAAIIAFVCPLAALFIAISANSKANAAEQTLRQLKKEIAQLRASPGAVAATSNPPSPQASTRDEIKPAQEGIPTPVQPPSTPPPSPTAFQPEPVAEPAAEPTPEHVVFQASVPPAKPWTSSHDIPEPVIFPESVSPSETPRPPSQAELFISQLAAQARQWLFGGNLVAKAGLLILFIGISFLLKFAAAHVVVPIEFRLAGVVLADIGFLVWGWRIRERRPGISLPVQGAALAILMLVTFASFRMYELIPSGLAFGLLFALTAFTCLLAVLQNALWLAIFGIAGGFAAPILTSTGEGSHIALFSYYALLNAGILGIALKCSWRSLNLLGFVFTFLIGTAWGVLRYSPENYLSAQLFLVLFFLFYVVIAIVYAWRQAPRLKHYVDGTLVFGTPLVGFGLQYGLVKDMPFALAFSSLTTGLFYMLATLTLWRRRGGTLKLLTESFLALGIVFGTLTIPFALDGRWTSAAWALEGAGIVWVGLRQRQTIAWVFGLLVQAGAWISFIASITGLDATAATQSNLWLGFLLLAVTAFLMAANFRLQSNREKTGPYGFDRFATVLLAMASLWLVIGAWIEIWLRTSGSLRATLLVVSALITAITLVFIARRMDWPVARRFALIVQAVAGITLLILAITHLGWPLHPASTNLLDGPFLGALLIGGAAFFTSWVFHRSPDQQTTAPHLSRGLLLWSAFWWYGVALYLLSGWVANHYWLFMQFDVIDSSSLWACAYGVGLAISGLLSAQLARRLQWRDLRWSSISAWLGLGIASVLILSRLYFHDTMPAGEIWATYIALWLASEYLMRLWQNEEWISDASSLKLLHVLRTAGPWLLIWPVGEYWISSWLETGASSELRLSGEAGWLAAGSWSRYLPAWAMMLAIVWLMRCSREEKWPTAPLAQWYRQQVIPLATGWAIVLVALWNVTQDGTMAPLPYLPLLNPLDLTTCFAILLGMATYRLMDVDLDQTKSESRFSRKVVYVACAAGYVWFNLLLLRTVAHYLDVPYRFDLLFASQFVQAMLSLVWSATALVLMRRASTHLSRNQWLLGAALLTLVVAKLFLVDLSNIGGVERIISFVGVGLLMVAIGYLAPYPTRPETDVPPASDAHVA